MRLLLVYRDERLGQAWREYFAGVNCVEFVEGDICDVACDAVVSPANSFGFMDGGLDLAFVRQEAFRRIAPRRRETTAVQEEAQTRPSCTR